MNPNSSNDLAAPVPSKPSVFLILRDLFRRYRAGVLKRKIERNCAHDFRKVILTGEYGETRPHPHPLFADKIEVQIQPFMNLAVCLNCGKVHSQLGHNERSVNEDLPEMQKATD